MSNGRLALLFAAFCAATPVVASAESPQADAAVQAAFERMVGALQSADRDAFVKDATDAVQQGMTQQVLDTLSKQLGPRLKAGYEATYLCPLKQAGHQIHLWKLAFKDGEDDLIVRVVLKEGKTAGFFLQ